MHRCESNKTQQNATNFNKIQQNAANRSNLQQPLDHDLLTAWEP